MACASTSPTGIGVRGARAHGAWNDLFAKYRAKYPALATEIEQMQKRELPDGWDKNLPVFPADAKGVAGRDASNKVLNALAQSIPWFMGGSADLGPSNKTELKFDGAGEFEPGSYGGRNLHYGIREHAMAAVVNGMSLSKLRPYGATFFIFSDYARGGDPPVGADGNSRRSWCSRTTRWATARTGRRTSRSSSSRRCARCRA